MIDPLPALASSVIWALSAIYYKVFQSKLGFLQLNLLRTSLAAGVLVLPALYLGGFGGLGFASLGGLLNLAVGDTLFFISIRKIGASIAAPVAFTYVLFLQLSAQITGEAVSVVNFASAALAILAVLILTRGSYEMRRKRGIAFALGASAAYTAGNLLVKVSTNAGGNFIAVAFVRIASAAIALAAVTLLSQSRKRLLPSSFGGRDLLAVAAVAVCDLAIGSTLLVYSISTMGVAATVIVASVAPFLTQVFSNLLGKEAPTSRDFLGGLLTAFAVILTIVF